MTVGIVGQDPFGVAVIRPADLSDGSRHFLRKSVHKLLPECPAAILIDLSDVSSDVDQVSRLVQMTLLSLAIEAGQEPATPFALCTANLDIASDLAQNGPVMRVFSSVAEARLVLMSSSPSVTWIGRPLGSGSNAPGAGAGHVAEACTTWELTGIQKDAREVAFHLVWMARGPYDLHLTLSLRLQRQFLINVRNYSTAAKSTPDRSVRMALSPNDEARILAIGAIGCGRMVTGAGVAWWAMLDGRVMS